jgi:hypothetical protein
MGTIAVPLPLSSAEIKEGITDRICAALPDEIANALKIPIRLSLDKTCSLNATSYTKFKAKWKVEYRVADELCAKWWVDYELDDFGRPTVGGIGGHVGDKPGALYEEITGTIEEMPPDKFRRETGQTIPAPTVVKKPDPQQLGVSKSLRGSGKRRDV